MFSRKGRFILCPDQSDLDLSRRLEHLNFVGAKACGLAVLPRAWTPPFFVISAELHQAWELACEDDRSALLAAASDEISKLCADSWSKDWEKGLIIRSSAVNETMSERGAFESIEIPADFSSETIKSSITRIYESFAQQGGNGAIAIVVQARAHALPIGHLSNERRVSKTRNHWMWEVEEPIESEGRFNSQRAQAPCSTDNLVLSASGKDRHIPLLKQVARWCTELNAGCTHLEWGVYSGRLWLFQLDFETDQPDSGCDPRALLRESDPSKTGQVPEGSPLRLVDFNELTGWSKIDKVKQFLVDRSDPYPPLHFVTGKALLSALEAGRDIAADIEAITLGRAVCRTDCTNPAVPKINLPRTESVSAQDALDFMLNTLRELAVFGALAEDVCFIVHKFIPATVAAWALARPNQQIVLVDSLWGLPDGLQFLNHDTFEYDLKRDAISSETLRFKPLFLQETPSGEWQLIRVSRALTRHRSLAVTDLREVAKHTQQIASRLGKPVQIMWFCEVSPAASVGRNVPWFMMPPEEVTEPHLRPSIAPGLRRIVVKNLADVAKAASGVNGRSVLQLEPEADLFRDTAFIEAVAKTAREKGFPVALTGSILSHAFYILDRSNVAVLTVASGRRRTRQKQVFKKLVRDDIPTRISEQGERVTLAHIDKSESRTALIIKLFEEAHELLVARTFSEVTGELADLLEVLRALCSATGADWDEIQRVAAAKREARGGFERNMVLIETSWPKWAESGDSSESRSISLKELGRIIKEDGKHTLTFPTVFAQGASNVVELTDGTRIAVKITGSGVEVRELSASKSVPEQQYTLNFDEPSTG